jgi:NTE family protein
VATSTTGTGRSVVFLDRPVDDGAGFTDDSRPIDYAPARIEPDHLLASAAIPVLFPPVQIGGDWFLDGGVRLNTPIKPALALGADAVVVVATHPAVTPPTGAAIGAGTAPDVDDCVVQLLDVSLVEPMVEDVRMLTKINALAMGPYRVVPVLFCGPPDRAALADLAADAYDRPRGLLASVLRPDLPLLSLLLAGRGARRGELLSYLLFEPDFINRAIEAGRRDAELLFADAATGTDLPWCTTTTRPPRRPEPATSGRAT